MSEPEQPAAAEETVDPNAPAPPELDVTEPVAPAEEPATPAEPAPATEPAVAQPAETAAAASVAAYDNTVLQAMLEELRELKQRISAALGG